MNIETIKDNSKKHINLSDPDDRNSLDQLVNALLAENPPAEQLQSYMSKQDTPIEFKIASKLYESRRKMLSLSQPLKIAIVFAMWGEHNRLRPKSTENPNGEDSLRLKIEQLQQICQGTEVEWNLYAVDDGCPYNSGKIAYQQIANHPLREKVKILFLTNEIDKRRFQSLKNLKSADESRKGGAIIYGCRVAIEDRADAIIYTDADNSVHLGQIGLLLEKYQQGAKIVLGNRKDPQSVLVKQEARWGPGIKLLRHIQRMIGKEIFSRGILDTQAAFKLYESEILHEILKTPTVFDFSFDTDWLLAAISQNLEFAKTPFAFIDSFAESASIVQGPMSTWATLLLGLAKSVRQRNIDHDTEMMRILTTEIHGEEELNLLIDSLPPQLQDVSDSDLGNPAIMSPAAIETWIREKKQLD